MFDNSKVSDVQVMTPELRKENCELVKISRDKDPNSKSFRSVSFDFVDSAGRVLTHREFAPSRKIQGTELSDEDFTKNINLAHSRVAHITRAFLPEAEFLAIKVEGTLATIDTAWDNYVIATAKGLGVGEGGVPTRAKGVKCALKVVLQLQKATGKYFSSLPKVPPFISTANHPKEFSINKQYDVFETPTAKPDTEQKQTPLASFGGGANAPAATGHSSGF